MKLSSDQVKKVAKLANISLNDSEVDKYASQLSAILDYVDQLSSVNTENIEPTFNVTGLQNVMRPDEAKESLSQDQAIKNSSNNKGGFFITKGVFEDE